MTCTAHFNTEKIKLFSLNQHKYKIKYNKIYCINQSKDKHRTKICILKYTKEKY
jgi:hypothetical protein